MAVKPMVPLGDRSLGEVLASVDADRTPMPNAGMKAISAICAQASGMMMAAAASKSGGLGGIVSGAPAMMYPAAHQISGTNGAMLAGLGALGVASAMGKKEEAVKEGGKPRTKAKPGESVKEGQKPSTSTEVPKVDEKKPDPTPTKKPGPTGPVTISLSDDAAKKMKGASWIGVGAKPGDAKPESGEKVPTSIKAIPVKDGETEKKGYEKIKYNGSEYWVSSKDSGTYGSWNKAFATSGGLKADDMSAKEDPTPPKPVAKAPVVAPAVKGDAKDAKPPTPAPTIATKSGTPGAIAALAGGSELAVEKPKEVPPTPTPKSTPDAGPDSSTGTPAAPPTVTSGDAGVIGTPGDASLGTPPPAVDTSASDSAPE